MEQDPRKPYRAYYFELEPTGVEKIDRILREIAAAGKASHSTEGWGGQQWGEEDPDTPNYIQRIQDAANRAAEEVNPPTEKECMPLPVKVTWAGQRYYRTELHARKGCDHVWKRGEPRVHLDTTTPIYIIGQGTPVRGELIEEEE